MTFADQIRIININVNGFRIKETQIKKYIAEIGNNSIFAISDTRLTKNARISKIPGYSMLREDRTYNGNMATAGGIAIIVPQNWTCHTINVKPAVDHCESLTIVVTPKGVNCKPFILSTIYNHPGYHLPAQFITDIKNYQFNGKQLPLLIVGDQNSPHQAFGSRTTNEFGCSLYQTI